MLFALLARVRHNIFDCAEAHQGFAAEEVGFEHLAVAAVCDEEVDGLFSRLLAHKFAGGMIGAFVCEAVAAAHIAVVADMYAQRLYLVRLDGVNGRFGRVQKALSFKRFDVGGD